MILQKTLSIPERIFQGEKLDFLVLGREEIKDFSYEKPYLVISVADPESSDAEMIRSDYLTDVLRLKFDDVGKPFRFQFEKSSDILMTSEQANQILEFVKIYLSEVKLIVCQCEQGVSRSAAIAAALSRILQNEDEYFLKNYLANKFVYELLVQSAEDFDFSQNSLRTI